MKKLSLLLFLIVALAAHGATVSEQEAKQKATQFFGESQVANVSRPALAMKARKTVGSATATPAYYVFNNTAAGGGWVIIAGDDRVRSILAYGDNGSFNEAEINDDTQWMLDSYSSIIGNLDNMKSESVENRKEVLVEAANTAIAPLLTCTWGQDAPYYFQTPVVKGKQCVTGCVATAFAQVMYYYKWPQSVPAIPAYISKAGDLKDLEIPGLAAATFDWASMKDSYSTKESDATVPANAAVSTLMRYVGQAVDMEYGVEVSNARVFPDYLTEYFSYKRGSYLTSRTEYTAAAWHNLIYNQLAAKRPVIFSGRKFDGGHAFVCDGYDGNGLFHINWGWDGSQNGYFALNVLNPENGGTGSIDGADGYVVDAKAIIDFVPATTTVDEVPGSILSFTEAALVNGGVTATLTRTDVSQHFNANLTSGYYNMIYKGATFDIGWGIYDTDKELRGTIITKEADYFGPNQLYKAKSDDVYFFKGTAEGTYHLLPICRVSNGGTWQPILGAGENYIEAVIDGNTCRMTAYGSKAAGTLSVDKVQLSGNSKVGHPMEMVAAVTNSSDCDYHIVYLKLGDKLLGANSVQVEKGTTANAIVHFSPISAGPTEVKLYGDLECTNLLYSGSFDVAQSPEASLTCSPVIADLTAGNVLGSTTASVTVNVVNNKDVAYDNDDIIAYIYKQAADGLFYRQIGATMTGTIEASSSATVNYTFSNLEDGARYMIIPYYYSLGKQVQGNKSVVFTVTLDNKYDVNRDKQVNSGDVSEIYSVITGKDETNKGRADINGDKTVNAGDISDLYNNMMEK